MAGSKPGFMAMGRELTEPLDKRLAKSLNVLGEMSTSKTWFEVKLENTDLAEYSFKHMDLLPATLMTDLLKALFEAMAVSRDFVAIPALDDVKIKDMTGVCMALCLYNTLIVFVPDEATFEPAALDMDVVQDLNRSLALFGVGFVYMDDCSNLNMATRWGESNDLDQSEMAKTVERIRCQILPLYGALVATAFDTDWTPTSFTLEHPAMDLGEFRGMELDRFKFK